MNVWDERFKTHSVFSSLAQLENISKKIKTSITSAEQNANEQFRRIERFIRFSRNRFNSADPQLVSPMHLDLFKTKFDTIYDKLTTYALNGDAELLDNANLDIDEALQWFTVFYSFTSKSDYADIQNFTINFRASLEEQIQQIRDQVQSVRTEKDSTIKELQVLRDSISRQITLFSEDYSKWHDAEMISFEEYKEKVREREELLLNELDEHKAKVDELFGFFGVAGLAGGYQKTANEDRVAANRWEEYAKKTFYYWIGFVIFRYVFAPTNQSEFNWPYVVQGMLMSTPFILLAGFASMQVIQHRRAERRNRRTELELTALDPYLASLDNKEKNSLRYSLAEKFFGQRNGEASKVDPSPFFLQLADFIKRFKLN